MPLVRQAKRLNTPRFWLNPLTFVAALAVSCILKMQQAVTTTAAGMLLQHTAAAAHCRQISRKHSAHLDGCCSL
jgi:hypothetical protein